MSGITVEDVRGIGTLFSPLGDVLNYVTICHSRRHLHFPGGGGGGISLA